MAARHLFVLATIAVLGGACSSDDDPTATGDRPTTSMQDNASSTTTIGDAPALADVSVTLGPLDVDVNSPTDIHPVDSSLLVTERDGVVVELVADGSGDYEVGGTVVDLRTEVGSTEAEKGLLGLTTDSSGEHLYLNHTRATDGATVIVKYSLDGAAGSLAATDPRELLVIEQPFPNHNGGDLAWGPDDMLWIGTGDGGAREDPDGRAQRLSDPLGKLLRLDPSLEGTGTALAPADNPHVGDDDADPLVWARGLRNPWRISFDEATGDLWIADVGQDRVEEVSVLPAADGLGKGADLGWDRFEGNEEYEAPGPAEGWPVDDAELVGPLHTYLHDPRCSISGGFVYRGFSIAGLDGAYLFSDFCDGVIRAVASDGTAVNLGVAAEGVISINPDESGEPLVVRNDGLSRLGR